MSTTTAPMGSSVWRISIDSGPGTRASSGQPWTEKVDGSTSGIRGASERFGPGATVDAPLGEL